MARLLSLIAVLMLGSAVQAEPLRIIALGDMPYGDPEETYPLYRVLIDAINAAAPDLAIHVGDTKSGSSPCSDKMLAEQRAFLDSFTAPLLYTPGDNEWTDCHRKKAGRFDPEERLGHIRATYFDTPGQSFGAQRDVVSQADDGYPENTRLRLGKITVITAHVVGSNNGFGTKKAEASGESRPRDAANRAWLTQGFAEAANQAGVLIAIHGDMFRDGWDLDGDWSKKSGFAKFGRLLVEQAAAFGKPVLLVYGDSHRYQMFRPFRDAAPNLMALQVFGAAHMHAVEIVADPEHPAVFAVRPFYNLAQPISSGNP